jgi:CRISPR-associated protein Csd1
MIRIRADGQINRIRCAIIKAYLIKEYEYRNSDIKEVLTVVLNEESTYLPYVLGRIFSILEQIQNEASGGNLAATIKDRYFNSASATPSVVFPILLKLKNSHIKTLMKKNSGRAINFERMLTELFGRIQETLPQHLSLDEQGAYILGYYHQTQKRFEKKETTGENK